MSEKLAAITRLAVTLREIAAIRWLDSEEWRTGEWPYGGTLSPELAAERSAFLKSLAERPSKRKAKLPAAKGLLKDPCPLLKLLGAIQQAGEGDPDAVRSVAGHAADIIESGEPFPDALKTYLVEHLRNIQHGVSSKRGRKPYANRDRDQDIFAEVFELWQIKGQSQENAITEVARNHHLSHEAVRTIFRAAARRLRSDIEVIGKL